MDKSGNLTSPAKGDSPSAGAGHEGVSDAPRHVPTYRHMRLREIAAKIDAHLKRFEADARINRPRAGTTLTPYWQAGAWHSGRWVHIIYVSYQGVRTLSRVQAEKYLAWLEQGGIGRHWRSGCMHAESDLDD